MKKTLANKLNYFYEKSKVHNKKVIDKKTKRMIKKLAQVCKDNAKKGNKKITWFTSMGTDFNEKALVDYFVEEGCTISVRLLHCKYIIDIEW